MGGPAGRVRVAMAGGVLPRPSLCASCLAATTLRSGALAKNPEFPILHFENLDHLISASNYVSIVVYNGAGGPRAIGFSEVIGFLLVAGSTGVLLLFL